MNKFLLLFFLVLIEISCNNKGKTPDVSGIPVSVKIEHFENAFFSIDSNNIAAGIQQLNRQFPWFTPDFLTNILGAEPISDTNKTGLIVARKFLTTYLPVKDSIVSGIGNIDVLQHDLEKGFQYVKYYFPKYALPQKVVTYIGPFDAPGVAITNYCLAIGLQVYAGKDFPYYNSLQGQEMYPLYISRRFESKYIPVNCMKTIAEDLFADNSGTKSLIEQMICKGRYWYLTNLFLPGSNDSLITGFTQKQLEWCNANEGLIWNFLLENVDVYSIDPDIIKNYMGDAPNTQGMPANSPGNIGQWIGWQIIKKYVVANPATTPEQLMRLDARRLFEQVKYKPK